METGQQNQCRKLLETPVKETFLINKLPHQPILLDLFNRTILNINLQDGLSLQDSILGVVFVYCLKVPNKLNIQGPPKTYKIDFKDIFLYMSSCY